MADSRPISLTDDPYYYLYYSDAPRPLSYFSLERELPEVGRVLRFDSLSKIVSAGLRMGFVSGPAPLVQTIDLYVRACNQHFIITNTVHVLNL